RTEAFLNPMSDPLGRTAGNWLEVVESVECLEGRGPDDLRNLVVECAARLLVLSGKAADLQAATRAATACLNSGAPRRTWDEMLAAQGADLDATAKLLSQTPPGLIREVVAQRSGQVTAADANAIGEVVRDLGGGRLVAGATIRPFVGVSAMKQAGEPVQAGEP